MLKAKLILLAFCLAAVAGSHLYFAGIDAGVRAVDDDALNDYVTFARQMKAEQHKAKAPRIQQVSIWQAVDGRGK